MGFSGYYAGEFIVSAFDEISDKPWIAPIMLFSILGTIWFFLEKATKK
jgi:hypothetical protein